MEQKCIDEVVSICASIINCEINVIIACRKMIEIRSKYDLENDPDFLLFVGVASETDEFPEYNIRSNFSQRYIEQAEAKALKYVTEIRETMVGHCKYLIRKYNNK